MMKSIFHTFFDSFRVKDGETQIYRLGRNAIGSIEFFPSDINPFMEGYGYVRVYDNGELFCDENLAKLITYTDSHNEFMDFCFELWKNRTNQKIYPNCIILSSGTHERTNEMISYRDFKTKNYLVE